MSNTLYMALRMLIMMVVSLYTSRVVLQQLGVVDFGIYTLIGGLALMMSFFTTSLTAAIQRYMNVELAKSGNTGVQRVFSASWWCIFVMIVIFILIAEIIGLWFLENKLTIPIERMSVARIAFQISLLNIIMEMLRVPYRSLIIAHERMSFFAYNSILEVSLKLITAILLSIAASDKLITYMVLLVLVAMFINVSNIIYCKRKMPEIRFSLQSSKKQVFEIGKFSGWNVLTSISDIAYQQGTSMILNIFYGVVLNASMGVANQVKNAVTSFTRSVQTAANPQIIKSFAAGEYDEFRALVLRISRVSFYLMLFFGMPIILNADYILSLWLVDVPPSGALFVQLMLVFCIIDSLSGPQWASMQAYGRIASYQLVISGVWILSLPLTYVVFLIGLPSYWLFIVLISLVTILMVFRVVYASKYCRIKCGQYLRGVVFPILSVLIFGSSIPVMLTIIINENSMLQLLVTLLTWSVTMPVTTYFLGLTKEERKGVNKFVKKRLKFGNNA